MNKETVMPRFLTGMPTKFEVGRGDVVLEGALITVDARTGRASKIKRVREHVD
jgi:2',3'-cyclic-nucleotide 2'-phosphodiesterase